MSSLGSTKVIHDIKDNPVIQVSCQKPSTSSKYPHQRQRVLDTLLMKKSTWTFKCIFLGVHWIYPWCQGLPCPTIFFCQGPSMSSKYLYQGQGVLYTLLIMLYYWNFAHRSRIMFQGTIIGSKMTHILHVSCQDPPKLLMMMRGSWHTFNHASDSKSGTHVLSHICSWPLRPLGKRPSKAFHRS